MAARVLSGDVGFHSSQYRCTNQLLCTQPPFIEMPLHLHSQGPQEFLWEPF